VFLSSNHEAAHEVSSPLAPLKRTRKPGTILRWWRAPLWLLALGTGAKSFADNPIIGSERLNRRGLHVARMTLAHRMTWRRRRRLAAAVPAEWREQFDLDGFVEIRDFVAPETFARLRTALLETASECRQQQQGNTVTRRVPLDGALLRRAPELRALIGSSRWKSLLAYVAGTRSEPLLYLQTIVGGVADGPSDPQLDLHSDTFHPSLKAWLFLTDVTNDEGPLTYVAGSHLLTPERVAWEHERSISIARADRLSQRGSFRIRPDELPALKLPQAHRFAVPANTLVAIDTCGFHARGSSSRPFVRVEIWAYSRRNPFLPWTGLDPLSWRLFARRRESWLLKGIDVLDRLGLKPQHWRKGGRKRAAER
jgi:hypothetical protein